MISLRRLCLSLSLVAGSLGTAAAQQVTVQVGLDHSVLAANTKQTSYLRVGLQGFESTSESTRAPLNVAIVIDKSGSMSGEKIANARAAAKAALDALSPDDIVAVVAFDDTVQVLVPATKASDRATIVQGIDRLNAGGMTALFAGVVKGGAEVRKFLSKERVNRVILLSDGQANVGYSSSASLGQLGAQLRKEGIAVTTLGLGLGYNEDLLVQLARESGGQHVFIEDHHQLAKVFREGFGGLASIVAQEVTITIKLADGVRAVRVLGKDAEIIGQTVTVQMAELYAGQLDDVLLEIEVPVTAPQSKQIASVDVTYHNAITRAADRIAMTISAEFADDLGRVERSAQKDVAVAVTERLANEASQRAVALRDEGKIEEARRLIEDNAKRLQEGARRWDSKTLDRLSKDYELDADNLDGDGWNKQRKHMARRNYVSPYQLDNTNF